MREVTWLTIGGTFAFFFIAVTGYILFVKWRASENEQARRFRDMNRH